MPRILEAVRRLGYVFAALPMTFDAGTAKERHVQRVTKVSGTDHLILDLLIAEASLTGLLEDAREIALPEGPLVVVSRSALLLMKRLAGRPQDLADLAALDGLDDAR